MLDSLLAVPPGARVSELDRLRRGPVRISGPQMRWALERAKEITDLRMGEQQSPSSLVRPCLTDGLEGA